MATQRTNGLKQNKVLPLTQRPLDLLYYGFFASHLCASLLLDCQAIYPKRFVPTILVEANKLYMSMTRDPLIGGVFGVYGREFYQHTLWFRMFLYLEIFFQVPVFVIGMCQLGKGAKSVYPLLLAYGAQSATTTFACLAVLLTTPTTTPELLASNTPSLDAFQRQLLVGSYFAFFAVPLLMAVDMTCRIKRLIQKALKSEKLE
ncbi:transmembrane protein 6/97 [Panaeolus papilionaceus]|nr:transmembrane protein 6/97 [Panaeolus papilionaceus]